MSTEMTRTHRFRYDIGATLRWATVEDTGYRYHIIGYDFRDGQFGYMVRHNDGNDGGPLFYSAREVEQDWRFIAAEEPKACPHGHTDLDGQCISLCTAATEEPTP